jgi:thymidine phosphorylase
MCDGITILTMNAQPFEAVDLIRNKRDGTELSDEQINWLISSYTAGDVPEEQMSALLMAIYWRGLTARELKRWTGAMIESGSRLSFSGLSRPTVDKHSTGGVGDKVSLVLAPLVAACGATVPMLSGRGLAHTGGTLDKLEAIPGWHGDLTESQLKLQLEQVGAVICAAGGNLAPADRKLYALRDVTATVDSIPLIAASIMSKKIAEGTGALVLDVKVGQGAFMTSVEKARELAETMVGLGRDYGIKVSALLTGMDAPIGRAVGNGVEVTEAVRTLSGDGPDDLVEITLALARQMLESVGIEADPAAALADGSALAVWRRMIRGQGGDPDAPLPEAGAVDYVTAEHDGTVVNVNALDVGVAAWHLGAGRSRQEDPVDPAAGVICHVRPGDQIHTGDKLFELRSSEESRISLGRELLTGAVRYDGPGALPLVVERIG